MDEEVIRRYVQKGMIARLEIFELDDLFEFTDYNRIVWASDNSISIKMNTEPEPDGVDLCIDGYEVFHFDTFVEAIHGFIHMFMGCPSDTDMEPTYGQIFGRGSFGGVG